MLESKKIKFKSFELPSEKLSAIETALLLNVSPSIVFKTIVVVREREKPLLCVIPAPNEVDLKAVASLCNEKKVRVPSQNEAEKLTRLLAGGISPLALINKGFTTYLDESANQFESIHISGGQRGLNIKLPVSSLLALTHARLAKISLPIAESPDKFLHNFPQ